MRRLRSLWYESRHLDAGAAELRPRLAALPAHARDLLLAVGDRLAATSLTLAQQYCRQAPAAWALGEGAFARWVAGGERLALGDHGSRNAAASYFAEAPAALASLPAAELDAWLTLASDVLVVSRRLGEAFVTASLPALAGLAPGDGRLRRWVAEGLSLARHGFDGEVLALAFFEATGLAAPLFAPRDYARFAALGRAAAAAGRARVDLFASLPPALRELDEAERGGVLELATLAAERAPALGVEAYFSLPAALAVVPEARADLLASLRPVARDAADTLTDLLPVLRAILGHTPRDVRAPLIALAGRVAAVFPTGTVPFYRMLPRLLERTGIDGIERWVAAGLERAVEHPDAGAAYFGLDSRTSRAVLAAESTAVELPEVQGLLKRYLQMLTGRSWQVAGRADVGYRPPFDERATPEGDDAPSRETALFPAALATFAEAESNLRLYRLIAAQHAGRREFGSDALDPPLERFFAGFDHPGVAGELFAIFDGVRVDAGIARRYRGLAGDLAAVAAELEHGGRRLPGTLGHLVHLLREARLPELARRVPTLAARLGTPAATVADSAAVTRAVYDDMMRGEPGALLASAMHGPADDEDLAALAEDARFYLDGGEVLGGGEEDATKAPEAPDPIDQQLGDEVALALTDEESDGPAGVPLDPEELLKLLQSGVRITAAQGHGEDLAALGLYVSDLAGKLPRERMAELQNLLRQAQSGRAAALPHAAGEGEFLYDEWDYRIADYRHAWCRLAEIPLESDTGDFFHQTLATHADLLPEVRRQFQRIRPERYRVIHGLEDGEDFDLDAVITARADRRSGHPPSPKLYQAKQREERDVATLFLVDMSASTDEPVPDAPAGRRVIDITKEALVVMAEALEEIGDTYGICGFSGHGRRQVELYLVKHFNEPLTSAVKGRIGAIEPKRSTRMGAALRHAVAKMRNVAARSKHVILLSDGFPQDVDYGDDRRSNVYGIQDTTMAFQEAARAGVTPFCITVDKAGHDYLKEMCEASRYLVIEDITALPRELPKIYQRFVRP
ncbi:MAG: VWA domain-containing protein [Deltaproteobacteria bacterium]|nr:VWA domain-containing protein [Deltaproteobacteria bacterium]